MARAYLHDEKRLLACAAYLEGEYGYEGRLHGRRRASLAAKGVERILEIPLSEGERGMLAKSAQSVQAVVDICKKA